MKKQEKPIRQIEYVAHLLEILFFADDVGINPKHDEFSLDGTFSASDLRLLAAVRDCMDDKWSALNHVKEDFKLEIRYEYGTQPS